MRFRVLGSWDNDKVWTGKADADFELHAGFALDADFAYLGIYASANKI